MSDHSGAKGSNDCMTTFSKVWPPLLVAFVVVLIYSVFMVHAVIPQINHAYKLTSPPATNDPNSYIPPESEILGVVISFHILFFLFLLCFIRSAASSPGSIPNTDYWKEGKFNIKKDDEERLFDLFNAVDMKEDELQKHKRFVKGLPVVERKMKPGRQGASFRFCSTCDMYKPDRTHHCRVCDQCVLRMDHHCPWICNCVGFANYKLFLLFLLYGSICCAFIVGAMFRRFIQSFRPVLDVNTFLATDLWVILAWTMALLLFWTLFIFWCFHMGLVFNALSTIERREKKSGGDENQSAEKRKEIKQRWAVAHLKYDYGSGYRNFQHIFGSAWMWLLPIHSDLAGTNGTYSEAPRDK